MKKLEPSRPMRFDSPTGIPILVGKNNLQNDKLTSTAEPNEWWLHAKDMPEMCIRDRPTNVPASLLGKSNGAVLMNSLPLNEFIKTMRMGARKARQMTAMRMVKSHELRLRRLAMEGALIGCLLYTSCRWSRAAGRGADSRSRSTWR